MATVDQTNLTRKEKRKLMGVMNALSVLVRKEKPAHKLPKSCKGCTWNVI